MNKTALIWFLLLSIPLTSLSQENGFVSAKNKVKGMMTEVKTDSTTFTKKFIPKTLPEEFIAGEKLQYSMHYGFVTGAYAYANLVETELNGTRVYHSVCKAETVGLANMLFGVKDIYESYFVPETNLPLRAVRNITEGNYKYYNEVDYYHEKHKVYSKRSKKYKNVPGGTLDLVSAFYYSRRVSFKEVKTIGDTVNIETYFDDRLFNLEVIYKGTEYIDTEIGNVNCMKFVPIVEKGRLFEDDNQFMFWVSKDRNFVPIRAQLNMMVGSFKVDLVKYSGLKYPLAIKK